MVKAVCICFLISLNAGYFSIGITESLYLSEFQVQDDTIQISALLDTAETDSTKSAEADEEKNSFFKSLVDNWGIIAIVLAIIAAVSHLLNIEEKGPKFFGKIFRKIFNKKREPEDDVSKKHGVEKEVDSKSITNVVNVTVENKVNGHPDSGEKVSAKVATPKTLQQDENTENSNAEADGIFLNLPGQPISKEKICPLIAIDERFGEVVIKDNVVSMLYDSKACRYYQANNIILPYVLITHPVTMSYITMITKNIFNVLEIKNGFQYIVSLDDSSDHNGTKFFIDNFFGLTPINVNKRFNFEKDILQNKQDQLNDIEYGSSVLIAEQYIGPENANKLLLMMTYLKNQFNLNIAGIFSLIKNEDLDENTFDDFFDKNKIYSPIFFKGEIKT